MEAILLNGNLWVSCYHRKCDRDETKQDKTKLNLSYQILTVHFCVSNTEIVIELSDDLNTNQIRVVEDIYKYSKVNVI